MDLGNALNYELDDDGFPGVQVDLFGGPEAGAPPFELHAPLGLFCSPIDPEKDGDAKPTASACTVGYWYEGSRGHAVVYNDPRVIALVTNLGLPKGSTVLYPVRPAGLSYIAMRSDDGSINITHANGSSVVISDSGISIKGNVSIDGNVTVNGTLAVGTGGDPLADGTVTAQILAQLIPIVAAITSVTPGAPAAALASLVAKIPVKSATST